MTPLSQYEEASLHQTVGWNLESDVYQNRVEIEYFRVTDTEVVLLRYHLPKYMLPDTILARIFASDKTVIATVSGETE